MSEATPSRSRRQVARARWAWRRWLASHHRCCVCRKDVRYLAPGEKVNEVDPAISHVVGVIVCHRHPHGDERAAIYERVVGDADLVRAG